MKTMFKIALFAAAVSFSAPVFAQKKDTVKVNPDPALKRAGRDVGKAASKVGNKTAEVASKGASKVVDKTYKDKVGPGGQTIYIDSRSRYYYVNDKGGKVYVDAKVLKDKQ
jgi:hypothetical protein